MGIDRNNDPHFRFALKTADETVNNSNVLQDDNHLVITLPQGIWYMVCKLILLSDAAADFKCSFSTIVGSTMDWYRTSAIADALALGDGHNMDTTGNREIAELWGIADIGSAGGDLQLQWCQKNNQAVDTYVYENSLLMATRII